MIVTQCERSNI